jgi:hypothetical protein
MPAPGCDPTGPRWELDLVVRGMPAWSRGSLIRLVAPIDRRYRAMTLPDPTTPADWRWWDRRIW